MVAPTFAHDRPGTTPATWRDHLERASRVMPELDGDGELDRVLVLAAHPDDESLGAAGLLAMASRAGLEIGLVLATAGEHSHPRSQTHSPDDLAQRRLAESGSALRRVAEGATTTFLGVRDGQVADDEDLVVRSLVDLIGDGRRTLLLSPWRHDGHPDHEACGRAAAVAAYRTGATLLQFPIWFWHWGTPEAMPWSRVRRLALTPEAALAKQEAIASHTSQVRPLSDLPGDEVLLVEDFLSHFGGALETYVAEEASDEALESLHQQQSDPWSTQTSWYERRKRMLTLAVLPKASYRRGLEVGCSIGMLAAELIERCRQLEAIDSSPSAVAATAARIGAVPGVAVSLRDLPREWPEGHFDLIVLSEVGYFMSPVRLEELVARIDGSLEPDGDLVLCHWRHPVEGWPLDGPEVHARVRSLLPRREVVTHREQDFEISVFSRDVSAGVVG